jgi:hypothetical protein
MLSERTIFQSHTTSASPTGPYVVQAEYEKFPNEWWRRHNAAVVDETNNLKKEFMLRVEEEKFFVRVIKDRQAEGRERTYEGALTTHGAE